MVNRIYTIIFALALVIGLTQCTKMNCPDSETDDKIQVTFTTAGSGTKSEIQDLIGSLKFYWETGDKVWAYDGTKCLGSLDIRTEDVGREVATFEGTITKPSGSTIRFFYFGSSVTAPQSSPTSVDYYNQDGNLSTLKTKLIADCYSAYTDGQTLFSGTFSVPFAIGKFKFSGLDFSIGDKIVVKGLMRNISIDETGEISYSMPSSICAELTYQPGDIYYIALPSYGSNNKVCFSNEAETKSKTYNKEIVNGIYYHGSRGEAIDVILE